MTLTLSLVMDLILAAVLILFFVRGVRRGLILTLCSLLAVFVAFFGGWYLSHHCAAPLQERLEPFFLSRVEERLTEGEDAGDSLDPFLQQIAERKSADLAGTASRTILFLGGFLAVLLLWVLVCHLLDLAAKLPGLRFLNRLLGGLLGLVKGYLLLLVALWILRDLLDVIPAAALSGSRLLPFFSPVSLPSLLGL